MKNPALGGAMKSPFPGMDPFLERHWGDVHATLIVHARDLLQPQLPDDLLARIEQRVFLEYDDVRIRSVVPDLRISEAYPEPGAPPATLREGDTAVAQPVVFELDEVEIVQCFLEIREGDNGKVVTVIEFLSPANKRCGEGQDKTLQKQITNSITAPTSIHPFRPRTQLGPRHCCGLRGAVEPAQVPRTRNGRG